MRKFALVCLLALVVGCTAEKAPRFGVGDRILLMPEKQLGAVVSAEWSGSGCWHYEVQTKAGKIDLYDRDEKNDRVRLYQAMDWNEVETCPRIQIEGVPPIVPMNPTPAPTPQLAPPYRQDIFDDPSLILLVLKGEIFQHEEPCLQA